MTVLRYFALDVVRGFALLAVLLGHAPFKAALAASQPATKAFGFGWLGVQLFFVLSGYLVTGLVFRFGAKRFLLHRAFKIYPSYYFLLFVLWVSGAAPVEKLAVDALFLQSYLPGSFGHLWSLAVEEHFYLLLAAAVPWLGGRRLPAAAIVLATASVLWRMALPEPYDARTHLCPTHLNFDSLMLGVVLAWVQRFEPERFRRWTASRGRLLAVAAAGLAPLAFRAAGWLPTNGKTWELASANLAFAAIVALAITVELRPGIVSRALAGLGHVSYATYLWHLPVKHALVAAGFVAETAPWLSLAVYLAAAGLVGTAATVAVERPLLRYRDKGMGAAA